MDASVPNRARERAFGVCLGVEKRKTSSEVFF
jgi:hypothetical protein